MRERDREKKRKGEVGEEVKGRERREGGEEIY